MILDVVRLPSNVACLQPLVDAGVIGATEVRLASFVADATGIDDEHVTFAAAAATWAMLNGHDCADLRRLADVVDADLRRRAVDTVQPADPSERTPLPWPDPDQWLAGLRRADVAAAVREAHGPDQVIESAPLVLSGDRVYLQRLWIDEGIVAEGMTIRSGAVPPVDGAVHRLLDSLLSPVGPTGEPNQQRAAADAVLANGVTILVGGPGTGKTYSVARVLAALFEASPDLRVALAAPTGKAKQRLEETIRTAAREIGDAVSDATVSKMLALRPTTIHGLLGAQGTTGRYRRSRSNPLEHDIVIIDETSMVSLPLAARLLDAMRPETRLVLVGDPDQLVSVELGAMLADLVSAADGPALHSRVIRLTENHRFSGASPIALLAQRLQARDGDGAVEFVSSATDHDLVETDATSTVRFVETTKADAPQAVAEVRAMVSPALRELRDSAEAGDADAALAALGLVRILCAHRRGPAGVATWNRLAEEWMRGPQAGRASWFAGRPILVTKNDDRLGLSNGDTGVVVHRGDSQEVAFLDVDGKPIFFPTFALADVETCFAMTVHKSQGSEYPSVAFVLPPEDSPLIGRELAYTGITRARNHLLLVGSTKVLSACATTPTIRMTGLTEALGVR